MNVAIVDDDHKILDSVQKLVGTFCEEHGIPADISVFDEPQLFIDSIRDNRYSLVVMDIYFKGLSETGVDAITKLREIDRGSIVMFLTDSGDHMPAAFAVHAFSYIMKSDLEKLMPQALEDMVRIIPEARTITVPYKRQQMVLRITDIMVVQAEGHYILIRRNGEEDLRVRMTFSELSQKLENMEEFLSINKGILVNMDYISQFRNNGVILTDESFLPVRTRGYAAIERQWHEYNFAKLRTGIV